jgi:lysophospholipid acyltransferase (LPLAT)-like uncharacterized protein
MKRIFNKWAFRCLQLMLLILFKAFHKTYRYKYYDVHCRFEAAKSHPRGSSLIALWHEHLWACIGTHSKQGLSPIVSQSEDGDLASYICSKQGMHPIRGSSSRGGKQARSDLEMALVNGATGILTVDGPRGPRRKTKLGIIALAQASQSKIVPVANAADRYWQFNSWDQFKLPKPFARIFVVYGPPIEIPQSAQGRVALKKYAPLVEKAIDDVDDIAKTLISHSGSEHFISYKEIIATNRDLRQLHPHLKP